MIQITVQSTPVQAALDELTRRCQHMQPVFNEVGLKLHQNIVDCFEQEKSPDGINWAALSPATKIAKAKRAADGQMMTKNGRHTTAKFTRAYLSGNILRDTGAMYASLGHNATDNYAEVTIGQDYAPWHQFGTDNIPARPFFPSENMPSLWTDEILEIIRQHLEL
jgi:phage gpG-like protein